MVQEIITYIIVAVARVVSIRFIFGLGRKKQSCSCGCGGKKGGKECGQKYDKDSDLCRGCTLQSVCHPKTK